MKYTIKELNIFKVYDYQKACFQVLLYIYPPQTKFDKVMFLHLSVSHSVHLEGGKHLSRYPRAGTPPWTGTPSRAGTSPRQVHPPRSACWDTVNKRSVRVPLECILVLAKCFINKIKIAVGSLTLS